MNLKISIEDKAKLFLEKKGNLLVISKLDIVRGCASFEDLDVSYKKPQTGNYEQYYRVGITIYIQKELEFDQNHVKIVVAGIGPLKTIAVGGLKRSIARS